LSLSKSQSGLSHWTGEFKPRRQSEFRMADPSSNVIPSPIAHLPTVRILNLGPQAKGTLRAFVDLN
jgi:hypothetical protein